MDMQNKIKANIEQNKLISSWNLFLYKILETRTFEFIQSTKKFYFISNIIKKVLFKYPGNTEFFFKKML